MVSTAGAAVAVWNGSYRKWEGPHTWGIVALVVLTAPTSWRERTTDRTTGRERWWEAQNA